MPSTRNHGNCVRLREIETRHLVPRLQPEKTPRHHRRHHRRKHQRREQVHRKISQHDQRREHRARRSARCTPRKCPTPRRTPSAAATGTAASAPVGPTSTPSVAASCVIAPSRPMDAPLPMLSSDEAAFTSDDRNGSRPSLATTTSRMLLEPLLAHQPQPPIKHQPRHKPPSVGVSNRCQYRLCVAEFHRIARAAEKQPFRSVDAGVKNQVHQPADDAHPAGQHQVKRLLAEPQFSADAQRPLPMSADQRPRRRHQSLQILQPLLHSFNIASFTPFYEQRI